MALEESGSPYVDVARSQGKSGMARMMRHLQGKAEGLIPFAPPFLKVGQLVIAQTANILQFLGPRLGLVPKGEPSRVAANQFQLTIADAVAEVHDVHHPIGSGLYYEDQKQEAKRRAAQLLAERLPKFLGHFEAIFSKPFQGSGPYLFGRKVSYVDLSMFQLLEGLRYAFPNAMARLMPRMPKLAALRDQVAARPRISAYLASNRRQPFNEDGIFRHYPELDLRRR